jgi:hypothetical protein
MTTKHNRCLELGVCQGRGADKCPECDRWDCEISCSEPVHPTFPFAPGVIQRVPHSRYIDQDGEWFALGLLDTVKLLAVLAVLAAIAGYVAERFF